MMSIIRQNTWMQGEHSRINSDFGIYTLVIHIICSSGSLLIKALMERSRILTTNKFKTHKTNGITVEDDSYMPYWLHSEYYLFVRIITFLLK
jgi:hypothetical protein